MKKSAPNEKENSQNNAPEIPEDPAPEIKAPEIPGNSPRPFEIKEITVADAAAPLSDFPRVSEHAIQGLAGTEKQKQEEAENSLVDCDGNSFDSDFHVSDSNGKPVLTKSGKLRKKQGRKKGGANPRPKTQGPNSHVDLSGIEKGAPRSDHQGDGDSPPQMSDARVCAVTIVSTVTGIAQMTIGKEWAANPEELQGMIGAWEMYCQHKGISELDPAWLVAGTTAAYVMPRLGHSNTQSKLDRLKAWGWKKWQSWRRRRKGLPAEPEPEPKGNERGA